MAFPAILGGAALGLGALGSLFGNTQFRAPSSGQLAGAFGPQQLAMDQQTLFRMLSSSPAFRSHLTNLAIQGQGLSQNLTAGLARRGLTTSGVGTVAQSLGGSAAGFAQQQARGQLSQTALQMAQQNLMARLQAWAAMQGQQIGQPTGLGQLLGSLTGAAPFLFMGGLGSSGAMGSPGSPITQTGNQP